MIWAFNNFACSSVKLSSISSFGGKPERKENAGVFGLDSFITVGVGVGVGGVGVCILILVLVLILVSFGFGLGVGWVVNFF